jgi:hypothetical protein
MPVSLNKNEVKFVNFVLSIMRTFRPAELRYLGITKSDFPTLVREGFVFSANAAANEHFIEFSQVCIEQMSENMASAADVNYAESALAKIKGAISGG